MRLAFFLVVLTLAVSAHAEDAVLDFGKFLTEVAGFSEDDVAKLQKGDVLVNVVPPERNDEVAILAVVRLTVPRELFFDQFEALQGPKTREDVLSFEKLSSPPKLSDFATFELPEDDLKDLWICKSGDCSVKLDEEGMKSIAGANDDDAIDKQFRTILLNWSNQYMEGGAASLPPFVDKSKPLSVDTSLDQILGHSPYLVDFAPAFHDYLQDYPKGSLENSSDFLYWSIEDFGLKPTALLHHVVIYDPPQLRPSDVLIGEVVYYASHYFLARASIMAWIESDLDGSGKTSSYLCYTTRSVFDGDVKGVKRNQMNKKLSGALKDTLEQQRDRMNSLHTPEGNSTPD